MVKAVKAPLGIVRFIDQPGGWLGGTVKPDMPIITNLRLDPFERTGMGSYLIQVCN